jgi:purine nucleosidase
MCGVFTNRLPGVGPLEWNAICDPYAAAIVYAGQTDVHRSIGLGCDASGDHGFG